MWCKQNLCTYFIVPSGYHLMSSESVYLHYRALCVPCDVSRICVLTLSCPLGTIWCHQNLCTYIIVPSVYHLMSSESVYLHYRALCVSSDVTRIWVLTLSCPLCTAWCHYTTCKVFMTQQIFLQSVFMYLQPSMLICLDVCNHCEKSLCL
jgi:hypothetical protein